MEAHLAKHGENISVLQTPTVILESSSHRLELEHHGTLPFSLWLPATQRQFLMCLWVSRSEGNFPGIANFALLFSSYPAKAVPPLDELYATECYLPSLHFFPCCTPDSQCPEHS